MKEISFIVTVKSSDPIYSDQEYNEMASKIEAALVSEVESGMGLCPEDSDAFTEEITVTPNIDSENIKMYKHYFV